MDDEDDDRPLDQSESQALAAEAARGQREDRELAVRLGRPAIDGAEIHAHRLHSPRADPGQALVEAAKAGHEPSVAEVIEACLPQILAMSRRYLGTEHVERLELVQEGVAGLLEALDRFDPASGASFCAYARPTVQRSMQRLIAELSDAAVLSDRALRHLSRLKSAEDELMRERHRLPTRREILERAGVEHEEAERLLAGTKPPRSLQEPITAEDGGVIGSLGDLVDDPRGGDAYDRVLDAMEAHDLLPFLCVLSARERSILRARYGLGGEEQSISQLAERLGISTSRVREIERRALRKLRRVVVASRSAR